MYTSYGYQVLGNFAAGEKKQVDVKVFARATQGQLPGLQLYAMVDEVFPYPHVRPVPFGNLDDEQREDYIRRQIIQRLIMSHPGTPYPVPGHVNSVTPIQGSLSLLGFSTHGIVQNIRVNGQEPEAAFHRSVVATQFIVPHIRDGKGLYSTRGYNGWFCRRKESGDSIYGRKYGDDYGTGNGCIPISI